MDRDFLLVGLSVFLLSLIFNYLLMKYSHTLKLIDIPNERSMHKVQKSRAGGIGIFLAFMIGIFISGVELNNYLILAFYTVFLLGVYDDIFGTSSKIKVLWIVVASLFLFIGDFYIKYLGIFAGYEIGLSTVLAIAFTTFAVVGFVNAMNLIDGLDGLSSGVGIVILFSFFYLGYKYQDMFLLNISGLMIFSLLAFLIYNWYPSKMFMGDSGSLTLGFIIAILAIHAVDQAYITPVTVLLLTAVPILDTLVVMIRRIRRKQNPFKADKTHIHHIILKLHYNNIVKTTKILILLQVVFTYIGLGFKVRDDILILGIFIILFLLFYSMLTPKQVNKD